MDKDNIVRALRDIASLLELSDANAFEIMAFQNGAENLDDWEGDLGDMVTEKKLTEIDGIGKGIAGVITELHETGRSSKLDELCAIHPRGLLDLLKVPGLGTKKVRMLHSELGLTSLDELETAVHEQRIRSLSGFSEKSEARLLKGIERARKYGAGQ